MNHIGIAQANAAMLTKKLNLLLADLHVFYQNSRGFHWNVRGKKFFELHLKFEELYNDLQLKIDEVAERVLTLGGDPMHTMSDYLNNSSIQEQKGIISDEEMMKSIIHSLKVLIDKERNILSIAAESNDEGTNSLMSDYIRAQEKLMWMYGAYLK
jgi:starvation-inducible DNA-binding protein